MSQVEVCNLAGAQTGLHRQLDDEPVADRAPRGASKHEEIFVRVVRDDFCLAPSHALPLKSC